MTNVKENQPKIDGRPVLYGKLVNHGRQIKVFCPHCRDYHLHGALDDERAGIATHRVLQCWRRPSPFEQGGYYVQLDPKEK